MKEAIPLKTGIVKGAIPAAVFTSLVIAVAIPLVFNPWGYNAFGLPKAVLLRALALIMGAAALLQSLESQPQPAGAETGIRRLPSPWSSRRSRRGRATSSGQAGGA